MVHPELSFDGFGINGPDEYRTRIATFTRDNEAKKYGPLFAAAPELLRLAEHLARDAYALTPDQWASEAREAIDKAKGV